MLVKALGGLTSDQGGADNSLLPDCCLSVSSRLAVLGVLLSASTIKTYLFNPLDGSHGLDSAAACVILWAEKRKAYHHRASRQH